MKDKEFTTAEDIIEQRRAAVEQGSQFDLAKSIIDERRGNDRNNTQVDYTAPVVSAFNFVPQIEPATPKAGDVYYSSSTNKLRCYNGTIWNDLF